MIICIYQNRWSIFRGFIFDGHSLMELDLNDYEGRIHCKNQEAERKKLLKNALFLKIEKRCVIHPHQVLH